MSDPSEYSGGNSSKWSTAVTVKNDTIIDSGEHLQKTAPRKSLTNGKITWRKIMNT
jgi:hypothetical protein